MASVENIVKVMNFHSLIRVDKAKREAAKYFNVGDELTKILYQIMNNRNLTLDKKILLENKDGIVLNVYIGNDLGFCGNFNNQLQRAVLEDKDSYKVVIGRKLFHLQDDKILLKIEKDNFPTEYYKLDALIIEYLKKHKIKEINVLYNRYYNVNKIVFEKKKLFPIIFDTTNQDDKIDLDIDYVIETDVNELVTNILALCICYQIKIYESSSWASENVMREKITRESIDKIEDMQEEARKEERKTKNYNAFKKQINNYRNTEVTEDDE